MFETNSLTLRQKNHQPLIYQHPCFTIIDTNIFGLIKFLDVFSCFKLIEQFLFIMFEIENIFINKLCSNKTYYFEIISFIYLITKNSLYINKKQIII